MTEEENTYKISVPLISDNEIRQIDNYLDDIVSQFTKQLVHNKDLAIAQHIIQKQQEEIKHLKNLNNHQSKDIRKAVDYTFELNKEIEKKDKLEKEVADDIDKVAVELNKLSDNIYIVNQAMLLQKIAQEKLGKFYID